MEPSEVGRTSSSFGSGIKRIEIEKENLKKKLVDFLKNESQDKVDLSSTAAKIAEYVKLVKNLPDIREEKIRKVQRKITSGEYNSLQVLEKTVEKIIEDLFS